MILFYVRIKKDSTVEKYAFLWDVPRKGCAYSWWDCALCQACGESTCLGHRETVGTSQGTINDQIVRKRFLHSEQELSEYFQRFASHQNIPGSKLVYLDICIRWIITKESQTQLKQAAAQSLFRSSFSENATDLLRLTSKILWMNQAFARYMNLIFLAMLSNRKVII